MSTILIIDDESSVRVLLKKLFERNGYQTLEAENGTQGLKMYNEHKPDLIITDLIMPEKEGLELIRELKKKNPDVKIIAISGGGIADPEMYLKVAVQLGALKAFVKPVDMELLIGTVQEILS